MSDTTRALPRPHAGRWSELRVRAGKSKYLLLLVLPGLVYFIIFHYGPMYGLVIAFQDYNTRLGVVGSPWVGFEHFAKFFGHPYFFRLVRNTFLLSFYSLLVGFPAPIIFALALNELTQQRYKKVAQTVSFLPHFISLPAVVGMLYLFLSPTTGFANKVLQVVGVEPIYFMTNPGWFRSIYVASDIWQNVGWGAIIFLAQLSRLDPQLYEAAVIDGASRFQQMRFISLPGLKSVISILLILRVGTLLSVGAEKVLLMYQPATYETADVIGSFVYRRGLLHADFSYGAAVGLFGSVIGLILIICANRVARKVSEFTVW